MTSESGSLSYPEQTGVSYPHGVSCSWRIVSTPGKIISVTFSSFSIENHPNCDYDYLQIHDGPSATAHKIGTYCGDTPPGRVNSTQHRMYLWFFSDQSVASDGFSLNWISADPSEILIDRYKNCRFRYHYFLLKSLKCIYKM